MWVYFLALPVDFAHIADRAFYLAGGYKYAMAGEGACFMHCPPGFAPRPRNTGWYASFATLSGPQDKVGYATDGMRFMGATFDPSGLYRMRAVLRWMSAHGLDTARIHAHVIVLQESFLRGLKRQPIGIFDPAHLVVPPEEMSRGNFSRPGFTLSDALADSAIGITFTGWSAPAVSKISMLRPSLRTANRLASLLSQAPSTRFTARVLVRPSA